MGSTQSSVCTSSSVQRTKVVKQTFTLVDITTTCIDLLPSLTLTEVTVDPVGITIIASPIHLCFCRALQQSTATKRSSSGVAVSIAATDIYLEESTCIARIVVARP